MSFTAEWDTVCAVASLTEIRLAVRTARREREWSLDTLSEKAHVDRAALHKIENVRKYAGYEPGIETIRKIVEALGLTLAGFFARVEGADAPSSSNGGHGELVASAIDRAIDRVLATKAVTTPDAPAEDGSWTLTLPGPLTDPQRERVMEVALTFARARIPAPDASATPQAPDATEPRRKQG